MSARQEHRPNQEGSTHQVLIVDGDRERRQRLHGLLSCHGLSVTAVPSGELAIQSLKHERPHLILLHVMLPDTSGWKLAERVRTVAGGIPLVLLANGHDAASTGTARSEVDVHLPDDASEEAILNEVTRRLPVSPSAPRQRWPDTILVVDDEPRERGILQEFLELNGFTVMTASSGEEALERLARFVPKVVLLDLRLPGMDGLLTLKTIRMRLPNLPVIITTQMDEEPTAEEAAILGANDYLVKPLNFEHLKLILLTKIFV